MWTAGIFDVEALSAANELPIDTMAASNKCLSFTATLSDWTMARCAFGKCHFSGAYRAPDQTVAGSTPARRASFQPGKTQSLREGQQHRHIPKMSFALCGRHTVVFLSACHSNLGDL
jgi:hypothetical protein